MTRIQIILLFTTMRELAEHDRKQTCEIVSEEYRRFFGGNAEDVQTVLCDGKSQSVRDDIILAFKSTQRILNEGKVRGEMKNAVANRLTALFPKSLGFTGSIGTKDEEIDMKDKAPNNRQSEAPSDGNDEMDYTARSKNYQAEEPIYSYEMLRLPQNTLDQIERALGRIEYEQDVFERWGLYAIMPNPISALSFFGPPGTGKTLAAEAIASKLGKKIIRASYADIESKYHGEGPKNVGALFLAAEQQNAVLFIDEADSLLSKRLTSVSQGSEQAINSMRSQLLICLEKFHGIVIFATNLVVNYDRAFLSRLISIKFEMPDADMRREIWNSHLYPMETGKIQLKIPLAEDVDLGALARDYEVCGREIRNAVVNACVQARMQNLEQVTQACLRDAVEAEVERRREVSDAVDHTDIRTVPSDAAKRLIAQSVSRLVNGDSENASTSADKQA